MKMGIIRERVGEREMENQRDGEMEMEIEKKKEELFYFDKGVNEKERLRKRDFSIHVCIRSYMQTINLTIELAR